MNVTLTRFIWGHTVLFLRLCDLVRMTATKVATRNCVPQGGRLQTCALLSLLRMYRIYFG